MPDITEDTIRDLVAFKGKEPVTSCFLDVDGSRFLHQRQIEQELESVLRPARLEANGHRPAVSRSLDRIERYVRGGFDRSNTRGLAFFSCSDPDLWHVVPLPMSVRSRVVVNDQPAVGALQSMVEQAARLGVLLVDRQRSRMFVFSLGELVEHREDEDPLPREIDNRARAARGDHAGQIDAAVDRHLHAAAAMAFETWQRTDFDRFTIGAPDDLATRTLELVHPYLRERNVDRIDVRPGASIEQIRQAACAFEARVEAAREHEVVDRLIASVSTGRAVEGLRPTLEALGDHRVATLVVSKDFSQSGWKCSTCDRLFDQGRTCGRCDGQMTEVDDLIEEAIEATMRRSGHVEVVVQDADLDVHGRIGAFLRY
ncbi:MAG TPA: hypothetical protein VFN21_02555 [Acidimicrobiales bacterium]|nr:hypothetical protein [Acidimicrobiales bacterium]